jgi:signal transduction histidine kinase
VADQHIIFEKFRQAGDTLTEKPQGTGLGLPISRQIVEHLGGRLWVESTPGKGATFAFALPVAPQEE